MISALFVVRNDEQFFEKAFSLVEPYIDEAILVDMSDTPIKTDHPKLKKFTYPYSEPLDMGKARTFSLEQASGEWIWQIDADEWYPKESCEAIVRAVNAPGQAISFRVGYHNLAWRHGFKQANFKHYPDRLYRRDVVDKYAGILPNDMTHVKKEFYNHRPFLEYDNAQDKSFENPVQPIIDAPFYHMARTRGYNFEYNKWYRYNKFNHMDQAPGLIDQNTRVNQWVSGLYEIEPIQVPFDYKIENPKVSVIIPNYNYALYVGKAIESILNQTYQAHEIIVVDDFSSDNSVEVISRYPVKLVKKDHNSNVATARNTGAMNATGDYLIFLDADDELAPTYIEETLKEMQGDVQVVYTDLQFIGDQDGTVGYNDFNLEELKQAQTIPSACALIDRRVFEQVGGFDNGEWYEDYGFWLRIATKGFNFKHIGQPLFRYRKHGASRIDQLDSMQQYGFQQLRERYGKI